MTRQESPKPLSAASLALLLCAALAEGVLSVYQWRELVLAHSGVMPKCSLGETINCVAVWNSSFAIRIHALVGMPVAGLGVVWGLVAFGLTLLLAHRVRKRRDLAAAVTAVRLIAAIGILSCITFAVAAFRARALCLTCLATYTLVAVFAIVALAKLPGEFPTDGKTVRRALAPLAGLLIAAHLLLLYPGLLTPHGSVKRIAPRLGVDAAQASDPSGREEQAARFVSELPWSEKQAVSDSIEVYRRSPAPDVKRFKSRERWGPESAPMQVVEFTDVRCGHCRALSLTLEELRRALPAGLLSIEARHFPLDAECNKAVSHSDGAGVSCLAAKAQICLEGARDSWELRHRLFEAQETLTKDTVLAIASSGSVPRERLMACIGSAETANSLADDIDFALLFDAHGTPLVLVNGREGTSVGSWLYAMAMTNANVSSKAFASLPPPMERHRH